MDSLAGFSKLESHGWFYIFPAWISPECRSLYSFSAWISPECRSLYSLSAYISPEMSRVIRDLLWVLEVIVMKLWLALISPGSFTVGNACWPGLTTFDLLLWLRYLPSKQINEKSETIKLRIVSIPMVWIIDKMLSSSTRLDNFTTKFLNTKLNFFTLRTLFN